MLVADKNGERITLRFANGKEMIRVVGATERVYNIDGHVVRRIEASSNGAVQIYADGGVCEMHCGIPYSIRATVTKEGDST